MNVDDREALIQVSDDKDCSDKVEDATNSNTSNMEITDRCSQSD